MNSGKTEDISVLGLSNRTSNCLHRAGIHTVGAVLDYPIDHWSDLPYMGPKSVKEILEKIEEIQKPSGSAENSAAFSEEASMPDPYPEEAIYIDGNGTLLKDLKIQNMNISKRLKNSLLRNGNVYLSEILGCKKEDFLAMKSMGVSTAEEAVSLECNAKIICISDHEEDGNVFNLKCMAEEWAHCYKTHANVWIRELLNIRKEFSDISLREMMEILYSGEIFKDAAKRKILEITSLYEDGMEFPALQSAFPDFYETEKLEANVSELQARQEILYDGYTVCRKYQTLSEFISEITDETEKMIFTSRLEGKTFAEIGNILNVSRERVRQRTESILKKRRVLYEDRYKYLYENYILSPEDFRLAFDEPKETYYYLDMISESARNEKKPIESILSDSAVSVKMRKKVEKVVYRDFIMIDGVRIAKNRKSLMYYFIKNYCTQLTKYDDFVELYHDFLEELGIKTEGLSLNSRRYENYLNEQKFILWNLRRSFRYYDISERDYTELLSVLNLGSYMDKEVSSYKFFRDYPELMREYDIRDEYELHNLLKKIWDHSIFPIDFKRMPSMEIGTNVDREAQVFQLLKQLSPITSEEFAKEYEELYGAKASTLIGTHLPQFNRYFYDGVYRVDSENLPQEQFDRMKEVLSADYYSVNDVKRLYLREFPEGDSSLLTPYVLKTLGFLVFSDYVISNRYSSAMEYFNKILTENDIVDTRELDKTLLYCGAYENEMHTLKAQRTVIEFAPLQYIHIRRLNDMGITIEDIEDYCRCAKRMVEPGEYFTIHSLRKRGFSHPLDDLGFDDWFYASLLVEDKEHFSYRRMGGRKLIYYGKTDVTVGQFFETLVFRVQKIDIYDFQALLREDYGLEFSISDIISNHIARTDLYYDSIMETIYMDYETYFEEI
ncbi:MAG: hypothetical protein IJA86_05220 [Clostridia bacterium]|nr:hypothetical protein [Clostridia bacterium]